MGAARAQSIGARGEERRGGETPPKVDIFCPLDIRRGCLSIPVAPALRHRERRRLASRYSAHLAGRRRRNHVLAIFSGVFESIARLGLLAPPLFWGLAALARTPARDRSVHPLSLLLLVLGTLSLIWTFP